MKRRAWKFSGVVALLAVLAGAVFLFAGDDAAGEVSEVLPSVATVLDPMSDRHVMQVDTPPRPVPAAGWPFQQLPRVAKLEVPVPQLLVRPAGPIIAPPPRIPSRPVRPAPGVPVAPDAPVDGVSPWLLAPLAAGALTGGSDAVDMSVIPEPSTVILMSTGLLLLGVHARRQRRNGQRFEARD